MLKGVGAQRAAARRPRRKRAKRRDARTPLNRDAEVTLPTIDPEPTMVVECASCRPSCWLPRRARPSSVEGGRGAGKGLNLLSSGAGGSGGGGTTVKGGGTGECAEAVTATIPCRSPRAIDRKHLRPGDEFTTQQRPPRSARAAGPVRVPRESNSEREMGGSSWGGACGMRCACAARALRGKLPPARPARAPALPARPPCPPARPARVATRPTAPRHSFAPVEAIGLSSTLA